MQNCIAARAFRRPGGGPLLPRIPVKNYTCLTPARKTFKKYCFSQGSWAARDPPRPPKCTRCYAVLHSACSPSHVSKTQLLLSSVSIGKVWGGSPAAQDPFEKPTLSAILSSNLYLCFFYFRVCIVIGALPAPSLHQNELNASTACTFSKHLILIIFVKTQPLVIGAPLPI